MRRSSASVGFFRLLPVALLVVAGCYTAGPATTVQRIDPKAQVDLSGYWNDTDANQVAEVMMRDCLSRPWAAQFSARERREPVIKLYPIRNRSSEHINTKFFTKQVEEELINSGVVKVVAASDETQDARNERAEQAEHASDETKKEQQQETGTDFLLNGWVVSQIDRAGGQTVRAYAVTMELINAETQQKVWLKLHQIKKVVDQAEYQW
ncbi:MAG: penicillin-binding protein activator LpoB [Proteobacteria bacterium]|nr:penicillin-binding protein activator LpoB [Pseudomonadota bacterium]